MHKTLICLEKRDFHRLVDISRHYAGGDLSKCYVFNKKGYTAELCKEKIINGVSCIVFGWSNYNLRDLPDGMCGYDLTGITFEIGRAKRGYIRMDFENNMLVNFKDESKIKELGEAMNISKVVNRDDFSLVYEDEVMVEEEEEEFE